MVKGLRVKGAVQRTIIIIELVAKASIGNHVRQHTWRLGLWQVLADIDDDVDDVDVDADVHVNDESDEEEDDDDDDDDG